MECETCTEQGYNNNQRDKDCAGVRIHFVSPLGKLAPRRNPGAITFDMRDNYDTVVWQPDTGLNRGIYQQIFGRTPQDWTFTFV